MRKLLFFFHFLLCAVSFAQTPYFSEVSTSSGIHHVAKYYNTLEGGVAWFDFDNDGFEDLFVTGGANPYALYRNNKDGTFTDVTVVSGLNVIDSNYISSGVVTGDIDNDGYRDLFITTENFYPNLLFHNNGNGTFTDISASAGIKDIGVSASAAFGDFNNDGFLDLFVENDNCETTVGPVSFDTTMRKFFYINNGNLTFTERAVQYGISDSTGCGLGVAFTDYDNDGDADLLMANDFGFIAGKNQNALFRNNFPVNSFADVSSATHMNVAMNGMGIAVGDYNEDGNLDYFITNIGTGALMKNINGVFTNVADAAGLTFGKVYMRDSSYTVDDLAWGCGFLDYDNDSYIDLFMANGDLMFHFPRPAMTHNHLYKNNNANGTFTDVSLEAGVADSYVCRGYGCADYNNDGHLDLYVNTLMQDSAGLNDLLYKNNLTSGNWLKIKTEGVNSNRDGYGARVEIIFNGRKLIREVDGGSSFISQSSSVVHFGLGSAAMIDTLRIRWPSGIRDEYTHVNANQYLVAREGQGLINSLSEKISNENSFRIYPNPVANNINFDFYFERPCIASLLMYDMEGKCIQHFFSDQFYAAGRSSFGWNANNLPAGNYICKLKSDEGSLVQKLVVVK